MPLDAKEIIISNMRVKAAKDELEDLRKLHRTVQENQYESQTIDSNMPGLTTKIKLLEQFVESQDKKISRLQDHIGDHISIEDLYASNMGDEIEVLVNSLNDHSLDMGYNATTFNTMKENAKLTSGLLDKYEDSVY